MVGNHDNEKSVYSSGELIAVAFNPKGWGPLCVEIGLYADIS